MLHVKMVMRYVKYVVRQKHSEKNCFYKFPFSWFDKCVYDIQPISGGWHDLVFFRRALSHPHVVQPSLGATKCSVIATLRVGYWGLFSPK